MARETCPGPHCSGQFYKVEGGEFCAACGPIIAAQAPPEVPEVRQRREAAEAKDSG